jgi:hypothetical protein
MPAARSPRSSLALHGALLTALAGLLDAGALTAAIGCRPCDDGICHSRAYITIAEPGEAPLREGHYTLEVTLDGVLETVECDITAGAADASCSKFTLGNLSTPLFDNEDAPHEQIWFHFENATPKSLAIRVVHDGAQILDESFDFHYDLTEPGCDDDCVDASEKLFFDRG